MPRKKKTNDVGKILKEAPKRYQKLDPNNCSLKKFHQMLPQTIPQIIKEDIVQYFNYLRNNRNKESLKQWEKVSSCTDSPNSWKVEGYRPIFSFLYYDRITDGQFLALLLDRLEPIDNQQKEEISLLDFNRQCRLSIINFRPEIDTIDLKILQALSEEPSLVLKELTKKTGHSYAAVYRHFQQLKDKLGLRILTRINWGKLGVQPIYLLTKDYSDFTQFEGLQSYLDGEASFLWGKRHFLRNYYVNPASRKKLIGIYNEMTEGKMEESSLQLLELTAKPIVKWTFNSYDRQKQRWKIDFIKTYRYLRNRQKQEINIEKLFKKEYPPKNIYQLTPLETNIIDDLVGNYNLTQKELAEHLGMHAQNLSTIKLKLLADNVIYPRFELRNFLPIGCLLWYSSTIKETMETFIPLLQKLPFTNISPVRNYSKPDEMQVIAFIFLDDILYRNLVIFLSRLLDNDQIEDFQLGLNIEGYFGLAKVSNILPKK
jgi:DNA-binding Lrp family transcriptional regulator